MVKLSGKRDDTSARLMSMVQRTLFDRIDKPVKDFRVVVSIVGNLIINQGIHTAFKNYKTIID